MGGHRMDPRVVTAMAEAASLHLLVDELQEAAGRVIADITGAEAGYVTSGASAGLFLATAACLARSDVERMERLPDTRGMANEIVVQRPHRNAYDRAMRTAGARLVEVGYASGVPGGRPQAWQIEAAISERTVACAWPAHPVADVVPLAQVTSLAHARGVPVIVDAAAALPPVSNLRRFIADGADLVVFSGGKAIGGPQGSGILAGRAALVESVALQQQDMDVHPATWPRQHLIERGLIPGPPQHGIGRSTKVGKETIAGLVAALRLFVERDEAAELRRQDAVLGQMAARLRTLRVASEMSAPTAERPHALLVVDIGGPRRSKEAWMTVQRLRAGDPRIFVNEKRCDDGVIQIDPTALEDHEAALVAEHLAAALSP